MHPSSALARTLRIGRDLFAPMVLVCLSAAAADAAPHAGHVARRHTTAPGAITCETHLTLRALQRQSHAAAGPLAPRVSRALRKGLPVPKPLLKRGTAPRFHDDDDAAIVNDAPAVPLDAGEGARPSLRSLGVLDNPFDRLPPSSPLALHDSRGPPRAA